MSTRQPRRILVVDDQPVNLRLFEARLVAGGFEVSLAQSAEQAWRWLEHASADTLPHLLLLDVMMPDMDGFEFLAKVRADGRFAHIAVLMVTALSEAEDRARAFELGADDFLTKPVSLGELLTRARNLTDLGRLQGMLPEVAPALSDGRILLLGQAFEVQTLKGELQAAGYGLLCDPQIDDPVRVVEALHPDLLLIYAGAQEEAALEACRTLKGHGRTAHIPLLLVVAAGRSSVRNAGYEAGVDDLLDDPLEILELRARVRSLVRKKRRYEELYETYDQLLQRTLTDPLTEAYNRSYLEQALLREVALAQRSAHVFSLLMLDIDHFKRVNDRFGHQVGDEVLKALVVELRRQVRVSDVVARYGGEEFVLLLSDTSKGGAAEVAERIRQGVAARDWAALGVEGVVTVSIGVAGAEDGDDARTLIGVADAALYKAKHSGRNQVVVAGRSA